MTWTDQLALPDGGELWTEIDPKQNRVRLCSAGPWTERQEMPGLGSIDTSLHSSILAATDPTERCSCTKYAEPCVGPGNHPGKLCHICYSGCDEVVLVCGDRVRRHRHVTTPKWAL